MFLVAPIRPALTGLFASLVSLAHASESLPLDAAASTVTFVGDSFLHIFHGEAREISGNAGPDRTAAPPLRKLAVRGTFTLNGVEQPMGGNVQCWREKDRIIVSGDTVVDTLKHGLPQIREALMTAGAAIKISYRFAFALPSALELER